MPNKYLSIFKTLCLLHAGLYCFAPSAHAETTQGTKKAVSRSELNTGASFSNFSIEIISILSQDNEIGQISIYKRLGGIMVPIGALSGLMDWPITVNQVNRIAEGFSPVTNQKITIAPVIRTILISGEAFELTPQEIFFDQNDVYVDLDVLTKRLGVIFEYNHSQQSMELSYITAEELIMPTTVPYGPDPTEPSSEPVWDNIRPEDDEIFVLQTTINDIAMIDFVAAKYRNNRVFIPFTSLVEILEFPIQTDIDNATAQGWFIRQANTLTIKDTTAIIKGKTYRLNNSQLIRDEEDFYIASDILEEWFGLDLGVDTQNMGLSINSKTPFPFEEQLKRKQLYSILENRKNLVKEQKDYQEHPLPYQAITIPVVDVSYNAAYDRLAQNKISNLYNIHGASDFGYMTSKFYLSGDLSAHGVTDARWSLGRRGYKKELLGPLQASSFELGDINSIGIAQIIQPSDGYGVTLTNRDVARADRFDVITFIGDSSPGWDVELYRNGTLIDIQTIGSDGQYEFSDVSVLFGNNEFRILLFGPQGQIEEKIKNINANSSIIKPRQFTYNFSTDKKSQRLFEFRDTEPAHPLGLRFAGELEYGVTKWLTANVGGAKTLISDGEHRYVTTGAKASVLGTLISVDHARDLTTSGYSTNVISFASFLKTNIRFTHKFADSFVSEANANVSTPIKRETTLDLVRTFNLPFLDELNTGLFLEKTVFESKNEEKTIRLRLAKNFRGINLTKIVERNTKTLSDDRVFGSFSARGLVGNNLIGLSTDYTLEPLSELSQLKLSWRRNFAQNIVNNVTMLASRGSETVNYELEDTVTLDMKDYKLSFIGRINNDHALFVGVMLNFSFGQYPKNQWNFTNNNKADSGLAVARAFLDSNYNLKRDDNENAVKDIDLKIGSRFYKTDENGIAVAENLPINSPIYIHADQRRFNDQTLGPGIEGYEIGLRPGYVANIDYPIFSTSEIEGIIRFPENITIPKEMPLTLVNNEQQVVSITHAEFDGYFLFRNVLPGTFYIKIPETVMESKQLVYKDTMPIIVTKDDDFVSTDLQFESILHL